jgi:hypothetical protein
MENRDSDTPVANAQPDSDGREPYQAPSIERFPPMRDIAFQSGLELGGSMEG